MPSLVSRPIRPVAILVASLFVMSGLVSIPAESAESAATGALSLTTADHQLTLRRSGKWVYLNLGAYVGVTGGDFEIHVKRADYESPIVATQVDPTTKTALQVLPDDAIDGWWGLNDFTTVVVRNSEGKRVELLRRDFCPNSWEAQRTSDEGPDVVTYPTGCDAFSPFTKGMVWGLNNGWAVPVTSEYRGSRVQIPNGQYEITVRIAQKFVDLFGIAPADAVEVFDVTVEGREGHHAPPASRSRSDFMTAPAPRVPIITDPDPSTVADLVALPTWSMRIRRSHGHDYLGFAVTPWNAGPAPLVVEGFRRQDEDVMDAYQYFYDSDGTAVGRAPVGTMEYDRRRGHHHWHFLQFAEFFLVDTSQAEVVRSKKQSFCLAPTDPIDLTVPGATLREYGDGRFTQCGGEQALWVREVLQAGWGDTYYQSVGGQSFDITNLPNGRYEVRVVVNGTGELYETTTDNNAVSRTVRLRGEPGNRRVIVSSWFGIDS